MKREEKNAHSRRRILDAAKEEFARNGYDAASMNAICAENGISKGIIYHYFKDRDELYLLCVGECFDAATAYLSEASKALSGSAEERISAYFDARLRFFAENQTYLGLFASAAFAPPGNLEPEIAELRRSFDALNISVLTGLLESEPLREGLSIDDTVWDFGMYMDYFNLRFRSELTAGASAGELLREHEERCRRQVNILLYGVTGTKNG